MPNFPKSGKRKTLSRLAYPFQRDGVYGNENHLFFYMLVKFKNHDHQFLCHVNSISRFQYIFWVTHDPMDFKGTQSISRDGLFEDDLIAFKTNSCHFLI